MSGQADKIRHVLLTVLLLILFMNASPRGLASARSVDSPIGNVEVFVGDTVTLQCDLHNLHRYDHIIWYHKGHYLSDGETLTTQVPSELRHRVSIQCNRQRESCDLTIGSVSYDDGGTYKCGYGFINQDDQVVVRLLATGHLVVSRRTPTTSTTTESLVTTVLPLRQTSSVPTTTTSLPNSSPHFQTLPPTSKDGSSDDKTDKTTVTYKTVVNKVVLTLSSSPRERQANMLVVVLIAVVVAMLLLALVITSFITKRWHKRHREEGLQDSEYYDLTHAPDIPNSVNGSLKTQDHNPHPPSAVDGFTSSDVHLNDKLFHNQCINQQTSIEQQDHYANVVTPISGVLQGNRARIKMSIKYADLDLPAFSLPSLPRNVDATPYADIKSF